MKNHIRKKYETEGASASLEEYFDLNGSVLFVVNSSSDDGESKSTEFEVKNGEEHIAYFEARRLFQETVRAFLDSENTNN